jgi:PAS domain S-box-containing protein
LEGAIIHDNDGPAIASPDLTADTELPAGSDAARATLPLSRTSAADEAMLRSMFEVTSVGIVQIGAVTRRFLRVNPAFCALAGYSEAELLTMTADALVHPDDRERKRARDDALAREDVLADRVEERLLRKDGAVAWVEATGHLVCDAGGRPQWTVAIIQDITARRNAAVAMERDRARLAALAVTTRAVTAAGPTPGTVLATVARQAAALLGDLAIVRLLSGDGQWLEPAAVDHSDPVAREAVAAALARERHPADQGANGRALRSGRPQRLSGATLDADREKGVPDLWPSLPSGPTTALLAVPLRADGRAIGTLSVSRAGAGDPYDGEDERFLQELADRAGLAVERSRREAALRESEARFRTMADSTPVLIWTTNATGEVEFVNRAYTTYFGVTETEARGPNWRWMVHPDEADTNIAAFFAALRDGQPFHGEARVRRADGAWRWLESFGAPRLSERGEVLGMVGSSLDITERKEAEADRIDFLDGVAHDVKNPLGVAKGYTQLLRRRVRRGMADPGQFETSLAGIEAAVDGATAMIDELLDVAHLRSGQPLVLHLAPVDLVALAETCAAETRRSSARHVVAVEAETPTLTGEWDKARLERALRNLLDNALKYSPEGGEVVVRLGREVDDGSTWAALTVRDQGIGIPAPDLPRIFERFHRGGNVAGIEGTGIGLAGVKQIIAQHGGTITAESEVGVGSIFTVRLPLDPR